MAGSPHAEFVSRSHRDQAPGSNARSIIRVLHSEPRATWRLFVRDVLPAIVLAALLLTWAALTLHRAYAEGRECRARGGVILEIDEGAYDSAQVKLCTADY